MNNFANKPQLAQQKLIQLLETGENEQIEFKLAFDKEAIETLSAFANTGGGCPVLKKYELLKGHDQITNGCYLLFVDSETMLTAIDLGRFTSETIIKDSRTVRGDLFSNVDAALDFLVKHINKRYIISGKAQRTELWDYPMDALREIVINMIVHRDYTSSSEAEKQMGQGYTLDREGRREKGRISEGEFRNLGIVN